jgi:Flp pilus assembly protein TadD
VQHFDAICGPKVVILTRKSAEMAANNWLVSASKLGFRSIHTIDRGVFLRMAWKQNSCKRLLAAGAVAISLGWSAAGHAGEIKFTLPRRSTLTPVQRLNREGVEAIRKHHYENAETLFYKAYLLDPDDPFTLNNLGYISELQGQVDRAERFYELARQEPTEAVIAQASSPRVQGRSIKDALLLPDLPMQINHENVEAVRLLSQGRAPEADLLLEKVLKSDPQNAFTLNNLGVAKEMEGESELALRFYDEAAAAHSDATAVVTLDRAWRGKPLTEMAEQNARRLRARLETHSSLEARLAELNIRGVSAVNRNDLSAADQDFRKAYGLDPNNPFALNNIGYLSEMQGDRETAAFFYDKAEAVAGPKVKVGLATRHSAEGLPLAEVASASDTKVEGKVAEERNALRSQHPPIVLRRRDNSVVEEPSTPPASSPQR